ARSRQIATCPALRFGSVARSAEQLPRSSRGTKTPGPNRRQERMSTSAMPAVDVTTQLERQALTQLGARRGPPRACERTRSQRHHHSELQTPSLQKTTVHSEIACT